MRPDRNDLLHVESCALMVVALGCFLPWWAAGLIALAAGIGKELWDKEHGGVPSWGDIAWDAVGVLVGIGLVLLNSFVFMIWRLHTM